MCNNIRWSRCSPGAVHKEHIGHDMQAEDTKIKIDLSIP